MIIKVNGILGYKAVDLSPKKLGIGIVMCIGKPTEYNKEVCQIAFPDDDGEYIILWRHFNGRYKNCELFKEITYD